MDQTPNIIQMADDILSSDCLNEDFLEHHGVKGQRHGVRRYQNNDGSLTALGRQHYGIFGRLRRYSSPEERGYREAVKQKEKQQRIAVQKAKYAGNLKKMLKHPKLFTGQEIDQQIADDTRRQAAINRLSELRKFEKNSKKNEKELNRERKEAKKETDFEKEMQREAIRSQERQHKLEQKTLLDVQKQKDKTQAEREQAQREYQTQQQIAKGKTLLGRLQKGAQMTAAIMGIASNASKTAGVLKEMGFAPKKVDEAVKKINEAKEAVKNAVPEKSKGETPKPEEQKPKIKYDKEAVERAKAERHKKAVEEWNDWQKQHKDKFDNWEKHNRDWLNTRDAKLKWEKEYSKYQSEQARKERAGWWDQLHNYQANGTIKPSGVTHAPDVGVPKATQNKTTVQYPQLDPNQVNKNGVTYATSAVSKNTDYNKQRIQPPQLNLNKINQNGVTAATKQQVQAATEKAREIKQQVSQIKAKSDGPVSETAKFVSSISTTKLAQMLSGIVPNDLTPSGINFGSYLRKSKATSMKEEFDSHKDWQRKQRFGHDDMQEDAGEIEDAE